MVVRVLRAVRKSLEDDGFIGQVTESTIYVTIAGIRMIFLMLMSYLWSAEILFGKYAMGLMDRFAMENYLDPDTPVYGPIGRALLLPAVQALNQIFVGWLLFDIALSLLYSVLERFTLEDGEKAQRESDEMRKQLGDVDKDNDGHENVIISMVNSQLYKYIQRGAIILIVVQLLGESAVADNNVMRTFQESSRASVTTAVLAKINPYRDLLPEQDGVLRERMFRRYVLWYRSETISAAARRGRDARKPIAEEPFSIKKRVKALHSHWHSLAIAPSKPERWEDASDFTFLKPLVTINTFGEENAKFTDMANVHDGIKKTVDGSKLVLTPEQEAEATRVYKRWRRKRDYKVSYLKDHPPTPMAWVPVSKSSLGIQNAWGAVFEDGRVEAGRGASTSKLSSSKQWKPIFHSLDFEIIPWSWVPPGQEPPTEADDAKEDEEDYQERDRRATRRTKQRDYATKLKALMEEKEEKKEL